MPIVFAQPAPVATGVSSAYGAAQEYDRMAPTIAGMRAQGVQAGGMAASAYQAGVNANTQRGIAAGNQQTAMSLAEAHERQAYNQQTMAAHVQQGQQQFAAQAAAEAQQREAQNRAAAQDQHFRQQIEANAIQLSQAEAARLTRYQNADADVDRMMDEGSLSREEGIEAKMRIRDLKGPLELRAAKAQAQMVESHAKQYEQQAALQTQVQQRRAELAAKTAEQRTVPIYDPAAQAAVIAELGPRPAGGGPAGVMAQQLYDKAAQQLLAARPGAVDSYLYTDLDGKTHVIKPDKEKGGKDGGAPGTMYNAAFQSIENQEKNRIDAYVRGVQKADPNQIDNPKGWTNEKKAEKLAHDMRTRLGMPNDPDTWDIPPTYEEYAAWKQYETTRPATKGAAFNPAAGGQQQPAGGEQQQPKAAPVKDEKPQPPIQSLRDATPEQQAAIAPIVAARTKIETSGASEQQKQALRSASVQAVDLLRQYGSPANMPPEDRARYQNMLRALSYIPAPARAGERAPGPDKLAGSIPNT